MPRRKRIWRVECDRSPTSPDSAVHLCGFHEDGTPWRLTQARAIELIEAGYMEFFFLTDGKEITIQVCTNDLGEKHLISKIGKSEIIRLSGLML